MKKLLVVIICSVMLFLFGSNAYAVDQTGTMTATVIRQIVIAETNGIAFGNIYNTINQTCRINATDTTLTGTACGAATGTRGLFQVQGQSNGAIDIAVAAGADVDGIAFAPRLDDANAVASTGTLSAANPGVLDVNVGGLLTVGGAAPPVGGKNFTYTFSVTYQ